MSFRFDSNEKETSDLKVPQIMATIGPTMEKEEDLVKAIQLGARWFRLPCGYRQRPHVENARLIRVASERVGIPVIILLDMPSSRPRTGAMQELRLSPDDRVLFWDPESTGDVPVNNGAYLAPLPGLVELTPRLAPGQGMWFCDGRIRMVIEEVREHAVMARMVQGAVPLKSSNSIFLPDTPSPFDSLTDADRQLLHQLKAAEILPDWVALSLIGSPEDVRGGRREVNAILGPSVRIMAKFETTAAMECIHDILAASDGCMVARGDLGLAVGYAALPESQEIIVAASKRVGKPVVVATQVLEGFSESGIPLRAELSDLSLIARQGADAVMLGKETVYSPRPHECIRLAVEVLTHETRRFAKQSALAAVDYGT